MEYFDDVDGETPYNTHIAWAYQSGLIKGYSSEEFGPEDLIKRQDIMLIIMRILEDEMLVDTCNFDDLPFADNSSISVYAKEGVCVSYAYELFIGHEVENKRYIEPKKFMTRAETATIISRLRILLDK